MVAIVAVVTGAALQLMIPEFLGQAVDQASALLEAVSQDPNTDLSPPLLDGVDPLLNRSSPRHFWVPPFVSGRSHWPIHGLRAADEVL